MVAGAEITKTNEGRMDPLNPEAKEAYLRLRECIGREFTHRRFYDRWWDAKEALGYTNGGRGHEDEWFKFHVCRHTAATKMAKNNMNQQKVKEILGQPLTPRPASIITAMRRAVRTPWLACSRHAHHYPSTGVTIHGGPFFASLT